MPATFRTQQPVRAAKSCHLFRCGLWLFVALVWSAASYCQEKSPTPPDELATYIKANYTKYEYRISMRDGKRLFTVVYLPKDASDAKRYPILLTRTPYSIAPYGVDNYRTSLGPSETLTRSKYIFVYQDVRGQFMSEGEYVQMRPHTTGKSAADVDEASDAYDTIDWLVKNVPDNNGRVGTWGISYPGFYAAESLIDSHPALKASSPQAPIADWFIGDDFHHNGALWLAHFFGFISATGQPRAGLSQKFLPRPFDFATQDGYNFYLGIEPLPKANDRYLHGQIAFWNELLAHPDYDAFWQARNMPQYLKSVQPAVLVVGGWFDAEDLYGALHIYEAAARKSAAGPVTLVMGPWVHGGWSRTDGESLGDISFHAKTSVFFREQIEAPFFEHFLKDKETSKLPAAYVFETGTNQWRTYDAWPPPKTSKKSLYLGASGRLTLATSQAETAFDEYVSDPAKPVPYIDATNIGMAREYMTADQRLQGRRTDVLVYQTDPLEEDTTLAGPVQPCLFVSTTGTDSDWVVNLIDVFPDDTADPDPNPSHIHMSGYQQLVRGEVMRGRYRNSYEKPQPFEPGKVTKIQFTEPDVNHTFRHGHRIMIQVQSSWFPLVDVNPQKFVNIYTAKPEDFQKASQRVYYSTAAPSHIDVSVLNK